MARVPEMLAAAVDGSIEIYGTHAWTVLRGRFKREFHRTANGNDSFNQSSSGLKLKSVVGSPCLRGWMAQLLLVLGASIFSTGR